MELWRRLAGRAGHTVDRFAAGIFAGKDGYREQQQQRGYQFNGLEMGVDGKHVLF